LRAGGGISEGLRLADGRKNWSARIYDCNWILPKKNFLLQSFIFNIEILIHAALFYPRGLTVKRTAVRECIHRQLKKGVAIMSEKSRSVVCGVYPIKNGWKIIRDDIRIGLAASKDAALDKNNEIIGKLRRSFSCPHL
jgi:hypothetical protein